MNHAGLVLLADVGGTHVRFGFADPTRPDPLLADSIRGLDVATFPSLTAAARSYLDGMSARATRAVFACAGRIDGDRVHMTNHPWTISRARVRAELALDALRLVNDFAAMSLCVPLLAPPDLRAIGTVAAATGAPVARARTCAVLGPGTGLGVGGLLLRDGRALALETEGGHVAFAPRTDEEIAVLRRLAGRFGRVSNERLLSGPGLANLHRALGEIGSTFDGELAPEEITRRASAGGDAVCTRAVELFCELLGAVAGDFVLALGAWDGVYLGGGLTAPLLDWLELGGFRRRFEDKGRFAEAMAGVTTQAIMHAWPGLLGAAAIAVIDDGGVPGAGRAPPVREE